MSSDFQITGTNTAALFTLKIHRGDGMALLAMNWKKGQPPRDFVGFAIEYKEPGGSKFFALKNRLSFAKASLPKRATITSKRCGYAAQFLAPSILLSSIVSLT